MPEVSGTGGTLQSFEPSIELPLNFYCEDFGYGGRDKEPYHHKSVDLLCYSRNLHNIEIERYLMLGSNDLSMPGTSSIASLQNGDAKMKTALVSLEPAGLILLLGSITLRYYSAEVLGK